MSGVRQTARLAGVQAATGAIEDQLAGAWPKDSNLGHQLLLPPANWCPMFAPRTTQGSAAGFGSGRPPPLPVFEPPLKRATPGHSPHPAAQLVS